ncbi:MAG: PIG-L deacetylase family protein [Candidatus Helarchaeota archaeon]
MPKRVSIICAHPDDESFISSFIHLAVQNGHDVELVSMTKGEYGTLDRHLKGDKIAAIRVREFEAAAELYGIPRTHVHFLGLIDGNVTLKKAIIALQKYLLNRKPDIIFAPEYTFSIYVHPDHLNTGKAVCLLLKEAIILPRPKLFVYHSFKNSIYIPTKIHSPSFEVHRSQIQVIVYLFPLFWCYKLLNGFFYYRRIFPMDACRQVLFNKKIHISFLDKLLYAAASFGKFFFKAWAPED